MLLAHQIGSSLAWGLFDAALVISTAFLCRWYYGKQIADLRRTLAEVGDMLHKTNAMNAQQVQELRGKIKGLTEELESTRKLNVEIDRERSLEKAEVDKLADQRKELMERLLKQSEANARLRQECEVAVSQRNELRAKLEDTEKALDINDKACSANFVKLMEAKKLIRIEAA